MVWRKHYDVPLEAFTDECVDHGQAGTKQGYGKTCFRQRQMGLHRAVYWHYSGNDPEGKVVMHSCDNPRCINPKHLTLGTQSDNILDCVSKGRHRNQW